MATSTLYPTPAVSPLLQSPPSESSSILSEILQQKKHLQSRITDAAELPHPVSTPSLPTVPLIDISSSLTGPLSSRQEVAAKIREACLITGFFQITNHGIPPSACTGILEQARRFFHDLSKEEKDRLHIRHNELFRGWEPAGATNTYDGIDEENSAGGETKEGFNWGYEDRLDSEGGDRKFVELDGRRPGPGRENVWPEDAALPGFYEGVSEYYGRVLGLARHLFRLFALSLDLEEGYFDGMTTHPGGIGRLLWYPTQETRSGGGGEQKKHKLGLGAHTDYECFTLLLMSANPGLEILFPASTPSAPSSLSAPTWIPCPVHPGTLTVNVADFLMRWTNGRYKSTVHRVVNRSETMERYSVPIFFSINYDAVVETLPGCEEGDVPGGYKPIKAGEYVLERLRATSIE